ncbi:hypothetical protein Undi14_08545 [Undibacterium sp. 14-3-2]|uniref:hypothetical protein n=1 Tax=Undibacterium sp. 14-3-2 TaxID=2800129 RepID=UPI0019039A34|nr:hypothetical protein [Undibacterium sp. 14-3-2]MBK1890085.1 hypothetical protein [Undibacterium sp. 14-3-2]
MKNGEDRFDPEYDKVRGLMASGDMGCHYGEHYPAVSGNTLAGKIWLAAMGSTRQIHEEAAAQAANDPWRVQIFENKVRAARKLRSMGRLDARKYGITEITLADPDVMPRYMETEDFVNLYSGVAYANTMGKVFNAHLTISWRDLGCMLDADAESRLSLEFIPQFSQWCRDNQLKCHWIYSNESSHNVGLHTHFLTAIPDDRLKLFKLFVAMRMRKINRKKTFLPSAFKLSAPRGQNIQRQWFRVQYLCKGVNPNAQLRHANGHDKIFVADLIRFGYESPGDVACKRRCGISQNINRKQRDSAGYKSLMERGLFNVRVLYEKKVVPLLQSEHEVWQALQLLNF